MHSVRTSQLGDYAKLLDFPLIELGSCRSYRQWHLRLIAWQWQESDALAHIEACKSSFNFQMAFDFCYIAIYSLTIHSLQHLVAPLLLSLELLLA